MKNRSHLYTILIFILFFYSRSVSQLTGVKNIPGDYANISAAVEDLNTQGVGNNGVTFNILAGQIFNESPIRVTATGTSSNQIIFQSSVLGNNPIIRVTGTSASTDAAFKIVGGDYITLNSITIENAGSRSDDWIDYGIYLVDSTGTNGCQNNTIKNCIVQLDTANADGRGIFLFSSASGIAGTNSNNKFYNNTVQFAHIGYYFAGNTSYNDDGNEIGTEGEGTSLINSIGGGTGTVYGVYVSSQTNMKIFNTTFSNFTSTGSSNLYGVFSLGSSTTVDIYSNTFKTFTGAGIMYGVYFSAGNVSHVYKNYIYDFHSTTSSVSTTAGIYVNACTTYSIYNNFIYDLKNPAGTSTSTATCGIYAFGGTTANVFYNTIYLDYVSTSASNISTAIFISSLPTTTIRNNIFVNKNDNTVGNYAIAFKKSSTSLTNLSLSNNNNLFYAGTPGSKNLIFNDGTNSDQTIEAYKTRVFPRDSLSFSELPPFKSINIPYNLHIDTSIATRVECGGLSISTPFAVNDDIDGDIRAGSPGYPGSSPLPDIGADEFNGILLDVTPPAISYIPLENTSFTTNRTIRVKITDLSGIQRSVLGAPRLWYKKGYSSSFVQTTGTYTVSDTFSFTFDVSLIGGVATGDTIYYYIAAQDSVGNVSTLPAGTSPSSNPPNAVVTVPSSYRILPSISGTFNIGTGGDYATLRDFFNVINFSAITGNINANIISDINETASAVLNNTVEDPSGSNFTITIKPFGSVRAISGDIAGALIDLSGADRFIINGDISGAKSLIFENQSTSTSATTIRLINGAVNNTITRCEIRGASIGTSLGTVMVGSGANTGNTISYNDIHERINPSTSYARIAIYSASSNNNSNNIIGNNIYNFTETAIRLSSSGSNWEIVNNSIFQTVSRTTAINCINITSGNGHSVTGNSIGGSAPDRTGNPFSTTGNFIGINISAGATTPLSIHNNVIANITSTASALSDSSFGIKIIGGSVNCGTINGNIIGGGTLPSDTLKFSAHMFGIYTASTGSVIIENNTIGNITSYTPSNPYTLSGLFARSTSIGPLLKNNTIRDLKSTTTSGSTNASLMGIYMGSSSGKPRVEGNIIYNLHHINTGTSGYLTTGVFVENATDTTIITKNRIYNLSAEGTGLGSSAPRTIGIWSKTGTAFYTNNMISIGSNAGGETRVIGIQDDVSGSANRYYFNSVYIGGTTASGPNNSYTFNRVGTSTVALRNNIFVNSRTTLGSGFNYAIANTNAAGTNWILGASDYNVLNSSSVSSIGQWLSSGFPLNFTAWKSTSAGDVNSQSNVTVTFADASVADLHLNLGTNPTSLESGGVDVPGFDKDFDDQTRPGPPGSVNGGATAPDIGADEFDGVPAAIMTYVSSTAGQVSGYVFRNGTNSPVIRIEIVMSGLAEPQTVTQFKFNTNGSTNIISDVANAKLFYTGNSNIFTTTTQFGTGYNNPPATPDSFIISGSQILGSGTNYFWLTYDISGSAVIDNVVDAEAMSILVGGENRIPTVTAPAGNSVIKGPLAGVYTIGNSQFFPFQSLTSAVSAVITAGISGSVTYLLADPLYSSPAETFPIVIDSIAGISAVNTFTIKPAAAITSMITGLSSTSVFKLSNTRYVTIDGSNSGTNTRDLTIINEGTTANTAVIWLSSSGAGKGVTNSVIRNCIIKAGIDQGTSTSSTYGIISSGASIHFATDGNDHNYNTFQNNEIKKVSYGIYLRGASGNPNINNTVSENLIGPDEFGIEAISKGGIIVQHQSGVIITQNHVRYLGGPYNITKGETDRIGIGLGSNYWTPTPTVITYAVVSRNLIHDIVEERTSSAAGIVVAGSGSQKTQNSIVNNVIYNVRANGTVGAEQSVGIGIGSGDGDEVLFNTVSLQGYLDPAPSANATVSTVGIRVSLSTVANLTLKNNAVGVDIKSNNTSLKHYAIVVPNNYNWGLGGSDYNLFFADPSNSQMIFGGLGTAVPYTPVLNLAAWQAAFTVPQDSNSLESNPMFNSYDNPRPQAGSPLIGEGITIPGITIDILGITRGDPPTIGAYEESGDFVPPMLWYNKLSNTSSISNRTLTVTITDASGVQLGVNGPRLYYKKSSDPSFAFDANPVKSGSNYTFTIDYSHVGGGSVSEGDTILYYAAAQDSNGYVATKPSGGSGINPPGTIPPINPDSYLITRIAISVDINSGWNMMSNPVERAPGTDSVKQLYPTSLFSYVFSFLPGTGYVQTHRLLNGIGFWIKFPTSGTSNIIGGPRTIDSISVVAGWNMVGSISYQIDTSSITSNPPGIKASQWFGYSGGYNPSQFIVPGKAYWIKANASGKFVFSYTGGELLKTSVGSTELNRFNSITITDDAGSSQTLYFGAESDGQTKAEMYELPPLPPSGVFDARFEGADDGYMLQTHLSDIEKPVEYPILIQSGNYPITITWKVNPDIYSYELDDGTGEKLFGSRTISGEGKMTITNTDISRLLLLVKSSNELPKEFELMQNYPNPFNPVTNIKFALPELSKVAVEIYNILGQRVQALINEEWPAGYHVIEWNGTNDLGNFAGSGVYFIKISADGISGKNFTKIRKMILLR